MPLRTRKRSILSKIEAIYGTDPTPTGSANAIRVMNLDINPLKSELVPRESIKPYFGNDEQVLAACYCEVSFEVEVAGSGTAGTAPAVGPLLRACAMSETILAAAHTGTAQAGATATITLANTGSAVDDAYAGMTIRTTGGTGSGQSRLIKSYNGTTKVATVWLDWTTPPDATTTYSIDAQVIYRRITDSIESITHYVNYDGVLHKLVGARGNVVTSLPYKRIPTFRFNFTGLFVAVADAASPSVTLTAWKKPLAVNNVNTTGLMVSGYSSAVMSDFSFDLGNQVVFRSLPGGSETVLITDSKPSGSITQEATLVANKDWWTAIKNVTLGHFSVTHGTAAGNKVKIDAPQIQLTEPAYEDMDGIQMLKTNLTLLPTSGNDELVIAFL
ncbi:MAG TPA: hypothetical protein VEC06_08540 [Paucimonas sp.]|nr:hypothetical protein [Paucimonas sp.]